MLKVIGWTRYDNREIPDFDKIYEYTIADYSKYIKAIIYGLREYNYIYTGFTMNGNNTGIYGVVPVFNNMTKFKCSMKTWSRIISYAYPEYYEDDWVYKIPENSEERIPIYTL